MATSGASAVTICSKCGEPLNAKGECVACLLRTGLEESSTFDTKSSASLVFGDFEVARREDGSFWELGHGAFAVTYLAVDNVLRRRVALKVIDVPAAACGSHTVRERFLREARAAAVLRHPNIAAIYQFGASPNGSRCFYAMELVQGETLETRVRRDGPLKAKLVLEIAIQISRALMAAAAEGVIHRDLKPANIMLTRGDAEMAELEVKVIDFGLAKAIAGAGEEMDLTHGGFVGTPNFASPEQFGSGPVDARSDIYSLGATLWFALTGLAPHPGSTIEEIRDRQTRDDLPVEQLAARKVPAPVIKLLRRMLVVDSAQRPASARELMEKLQFCRQQLTAGSGSFFSQLKQRNVVRVAIAYGVTAWLLAQIATQVFPFFETPSWGVRLVILLIVVGFPIALVLAWAFELTAEGIKRTEDVDVSQSVKPSRGRKLDFFIIGILLVILGIFAYQRFGPQKKIPPADSLLPEKSIAVLPFENLSEEKANAYFADGIQGEILTKLAAIGDLKVISRSSTAKYKSKPEDLKTVARELGVANVLEGSVQRAGDKARVNVQLLDARMDTHLWAKSYDRDLKDVFAVESEVAQEIADALRAKLSPSQTDALATAPTRDTEAYDLFLKGEYEERQAESALNSELFDRAQTFYRQALARDPNFALVYARLAYSQLFRDWFITNWGLPSADLAEVKSHIDRALEIAPALADAHLALAVFHYWGHRDYDRALSELDRVVELQPNNANARAFYGYIRRRRGEWEEALAAIERAAELDPRDPSIPTDIGATYNSLRRWGDAEHALTRALALDPHYALAADFLARTYVNSAGDVRRAKQAYEDVPAESRTHQWLGQGVSTMMIDDRVYLDVLERHFADALKAWDTLPTNLPEARLRQLEARIGIQVIAGQGEVAKSECEQARALLEARLAERSEDRASMVALAWVYVCLGRNADAVRVAKQAADSLPVEKDALAGRVFLDALAEIEARTGHAEEAVKILQQLITAPAGNVVSVARLKIDPVWDPIRNNPDFQKLISEPEPETVYK